MLEIPHNAVETTPNAALEAKGTALIGQSASNADIVEALFNEAEAFIYRKMTNASRAEMQETAFDVVRFYLLEGKVRKEDVAAPTDRTWFNAVKSLKANGCLEMMVDEVRTIAAKPKGSYNSAVYLVARKLFPQQRRNYTDPGILCWMLKHRIMNANCGLETIHGSVTITPKKVVEALVSYYNPKTPVPTLEYVARTITLEATRDTQADIDEQEKGPSRDLGSANFGEASCLDQPNSGEEAAAKHIMHGCEHYQLSLDTEPPKEAAASIERTFTSVKEALKLLADNEEITEDMHDQLLNEARRDYVTAMGVASVQAQASV